MNDVVAQKTGKRIKIHRNYRLNPKIIILFRTFVNIGTFKMKRSLFTVLLSLTAFLSSAQTTLEECQSGAQVNYPLIKRYDLIRQTTDVTVRNISKNWLPQLRFSGQATVQNRVPEVPETLNDILDKMNMDIDGMKKDQYKVGLDLSQVIYDGGAIRKQQDVSRLEGELRQAKVDVNMYGIRQKVNELYFGVLLIDEQIRLNKALQEVLGANESKLQAMFDGGLAAESDLNNVKAERLNVLQQLTVLEKDRESLLRVLSVFCGKDVRSVVKPAVVEMPVGNNRPELDLTDVRMKLADVREKLLDSQLLPKIGLFASGYYGYPGFDMFSGIMDRKFTWNGIIGARITWNIGSFYTRKNDKKKIQLLRDNATNDRDIFLFNNRLEQIKHHQEIDTYRELMKSDDEIIALRNAVRKSAESKLEHGIIDTADLIREINNENHAKSQQSLHEIMLLKSLYDMKYTVNK